MPKSKSPRIRSTQQPKPQPTTVNHPQQAILQSQQWSGPLPPPAALEHFDRVIPNGADRIMRLVEQEQQHRIDYDNLVLRATIKDTQRGHWLGGLISIAAVCGAVLSVHLGAHPAVSIALVSVPVGTIINAILKNKSNS